MKYEPLKLSLENWRKFAISRIALAKEELEKTGYYDDWDNIDDLAKSKMEAFNLGRNVAVEDLMTVLLRMVDETEDEIKQQVKSAVQGLLEEIERKKGDVDASLSKILKGEKKDTAVNRGALYGWGEALFWVKKLVKKWLPDVAEGEE